MARITPTGEMWHAIADGDLRTLERVVAQHRNLLDERPPIAGGTWLHLAVGEDSLDVVKFLVQCGLKVNEPSTLDGDLPLVRAAANGKEDIAAFLLDAGSVMDTSASIRNPLFAAIVGRSPEVVRLLLKRGIDARVRYTSDTMRDMDATAFALMRGETEIGGIIALHLACGDQSRAEALMLEAQSIAAMHGPLKPMRIIPTDEDLAGE
ncbi:MAG: ankyrin repeat domain-containing protein [Hyphomonas sp.]|nr:ankyrin repeat domain-containing protein [Hyphomonas sp.]